MPGLPRCESSRCGAEPQGARALVHLKTGLVNEMQMQMHIASVLLAGGERRSRAWKTCIPLRR